MRAGKYCRYVLMKLSGQTISWLGLEEKIQRSLWNSPRRLVIRYVQAGRSDSSRGIAGPSDRAQAT
jgi:hypothetical protein